MKTYLKLCASKPVLMGVCGMVLSAIGPFASNAATVYPNEVSTISFGHGIRLADTQGHTLYDFDNDLREPGTSTCVDECAATHPPLIANGSPIEIPANWSLIERDDGRLQWAYKGKPLYRFIKDSHKGAAYGEGGGWNIAFETLTTPAEMSVAGTVIGQVLASSGGLTLYVSDNPAITSVCDSDCVETWLPIKAPWAATNYGDFSVHTREDGVFQWAYLNKPLFLYAGDSSRGDINGDGLDGSWHAMLLEPAPPNPSWTRVVGSDGGPLYANSDGMTIYMLLEDRNDSEQAYQGGNHCDETCLERYWVPILADSMSAPVGHWSVIETKNETLQWAYKGRPLFTLNLETRPGQLYYTTFRQFQWMKPIMYALPALQGVF